MSVVHLPGCDLGHTPRQPCSPSRSEAPPLCPPSGTIGDWVGCAVVPAAAVLLLFFAGAAIVINAIALDRLGWVDIGDPNYIRGAKPSGAKLVESEHCCGGSLDGSGVTQFFYGTNMPFQDVAAHYRDEMANRGYASGTSPYPGWLSGEQEMWFDKPGSSGARSYTLCFSITPFTDNYDLTRGGLWSDPDLLRAKLSQYSHPYVALYTPSFICGG